MIRSCCDHPSSPTALSVSSTCVYMVSASSGPRHILLQDLTSMVQPVSLQPLACRHDVTVIAFHPSRQDTFLLGFEDGTISTHSAGEIILGRRIVCSGEIGSYKHLHRPHRSRHEVIPPNSAEHNPFKPPNSNYTEHRPLSGVTAAAFIGSRKSRTVSVGADMKCKIVDFEKGVHVLRTWDSGAVGTSLCVLQPEMSQRIHLPARATTTLTRNNGKRLKEESDPAQELIAIGRCDGYVAIYNSIGLIQHQNLLNPDHCSIIDVEWMPENKSSRQIAVEKNLAGAMMDTSKRFHQDQIRPAYPYGKHQRRHLRSLCDGHSASTSTLLDADVQPQSQVEDSRTSIIHTAPTNLESIKSFVTAHSKPVSDEEGSGSSIETLALNVKTERAANADTAAQTKIERNGSHTKESALHDRHAGAPSSHQLRSQPTELRTKNQPAAIVNSESRSVQCSNEDEDWFTIDTTSPRGTDVDFLLPGIDTDRPGSLSSWSPDDNMSVSYPSTYSHAACASTDSCWSREFYSNLLPDPLRPRPPNLGVQDSGSSTLVADPALHHIGSRESSTAPSTHFPSNLPRHARARHTRPQTKPLPGLPPPDDEIDVPGDLIGSPNRLPTPPPFTLPASRNNQRHSSYYVTDSQATTDPGLFASRHQQIHRPHHQLRGHSVSCPCNCALASELKALRSEFDLLRGEVTRIRPIDEAKPSAKKRSKGWMRVGKFMIKMRSSVSSSGPSLRRTIRRKVGSSRVSTRTSGST